MPLAVVAGMVAVPSQWVEPAIAASIVATAAVNLTCWSSRTRYAMTLAFGFLHGLGFGGYFSERWSSGLAYLRTAVGFNLGVEIGQLAILGLVFLLVRQISVIGDTAKLRLRTAGSLVGAMLGAIWLAERMVVQT